MLLALSAAALYLLAAVPAEAMRRLSSAALLGAWVLHLLLLVIDIGGFGQELPGARIGFGPVLSMTVWLLVAVHTVEGRFLPLPPVRVVLALAGVAAVLAALLFPGEPRPFVSRLGPLHFALGVASYGLFAAAVLHAAMLDSAENRLRAGGDAQRTFGMPLLQLERVTFRFVEAGFVVLTATLVMGVVTGGRLPFDHKVLFSVLAWIVFAALLVGRHVRGWRGRQATRWLYVGAGLLLLAYAGSRFVFEVLLGRAPG